MVSKIEWLKDKDGINGETWNPVTGCSKVSEGCQNCYAERMAKRLKGRCGYPADDPFRVTFHPDRLDQPVKWKKPKRIFVSSMGDLFHRDVAYQWFVEIVKIIITAKHHTFTILTKRPELMKEYLDILTRSGWGQLTQKEWPIENLWLGITAENQQRYDERWEIAQQIPAAVLWVSGEPLLSPIDFTRHKRKPDWFVAGGETGPGARPMHPDWARSLRDQCVSAGVPFFFKQWGQYVTPSQAPEDTYREMDAFHGQGFDESEDAFYGVGKKKAGRLLDGREWNEYPKE